MIEDKRLRAEYAKRTRFFKPNYLTLKEKREMFADLCGFLAMGAGVLLVFIFILFLGAIGP